MLNDVEYFYCHIIQRFNNFFYVMSCKLWHRVAKVMLHFTDILYWIDINSRDLFFQRLPGCREEYIETVWYFSFRVYVFLVIVESFRKSCLLSFLLVNYLV